MSGAVHVVYMYSSDTSVSSFHGVKRRTVDLYN